jgi:hypothetical protein
MRNRSCIDSIVDHKSVVDLSIYRGGGLDPLPSKLRANPGIFANKRSEKLGTLICSARARTVQPTGADRPHRGPSGLRVGLSAPQFGAQHRLTPTRTYKGPCTLNLEYQIVLYSIQRHTLNDPLNLENVVGSSIYKEFL